MNAICKFLGIDSPSEFEYFEDFADIMETEEEFEFEDFHQFFKDVDMDTLYEIVGNYFEDISENLPNSAVDLYTLLDTIRRSIMGLIRHSDEEDDEKYTLLSQELFKFRNWYAVEDNAVFEGDQMSILDALAEARFGKLSNEEGDFDFSKAMDYELDDYIVSFGDMIAEQEAADAEEAEADGEEE